MSNIDLTLQYLHWALIAAHSEADKDCREVRIKVDLMRKATITSFVGKDAPEESDINSHLLNVCEVVHTALTGPKKFNRDGCIKLLSEAIRKARGKSRAMPNTSKTALFV